jgi:hypothetical protein
MSTNEGPLSKLLRGLGVDADLAPIEAVKRIDVMPVKVNIDLRGRNLDVRYEFHGTFRGKQQWTAWDDKTYDGDESAIGSGDSKEDALVDLLEKLDAEPAPKPRAGRVVHSSPFEPPTVIDDRDVDFDSDLEDDAR